MNMRTFLRSAGLSAALLSLLYTAAPAEEGTLVLQMVEAPTAPTVWVTIGSPAVSNAENCATCLRESWVRGGCEAAAAREREAWRREGHIGVERSWRCVWN